MRLRCWFFGCMTDEFSVCCRCDSASYDPNFRESGPWPRLCWKLWHLRKRLRPWLPRRCDQCAKRIWLRSYNTDLCSDECFTKWLPF